MVLSARNTAIQLEEMRLVINVESHAAICISVCYFNVLVLSVDLGCVSMQGYQLGQGAGKNCRLVIHP